MALRRQEILSRLSANSRRLAELGVTSLRLFGSAARDQVSTGSDVDLLVRLEPKSFDAYMEVKFFLEDLLDSPVDLVLEESLKPRLRPVIREEAVLVPGFAPVS